MTADYDQILADLEDAARSLRAEVAALEEASHEVRLKLKKGITLKEAMNPSHWAIRDRVDEAWRHLQHALHRARQEGVVMLIDDGDFTITEFARARGLSRQQISKLYNEAHAARDGSASPQV